VSTAATQSEYRILRNVEDDSARIHLARLDESHALCGGITFDGSPFDAWQIVAGADHPEDAGELDAERCLTCWQAWERDHRAEREARGDWIAAERTHKARARRTVAPQIASQQQAGGHSPAHLDALRRHAASNSSSSAPAKTAGNSDADGSPASDNGAGELFRMYRAELEDLDTPEARAELKRRRDKRAAKRAARKAAA
jgi:hypothetical protein